MGKLSTAALMPVLAPLLVCLVTLRASAQVQDHGTAKVPLSESDILFIHQAGFGGEELVAAIARHGVAELEEPALQRIKDAGVPGPTLDQIRLAQPKKSTRPLTVDDVLALVKSGVPEPQVLEKISASTGAFELSLDRAVALMREQVSPRLIRAMREKAKATVQAEEAKATVTLDDVTSMAEAGLPAASIIKSIHEAKSVFDVSVDDLIRLTRQAVPQEVIREIWARRREMKTTEVTPDLTEVGTTETPAALSANSVATSAPAQITIHRETSGGFSLNIPNGYIPHRETVGANALLSFTSEALPEGGGLPTAELQIFRYRSQTPERLTEANLEPIANNFLNRLQASYSAKKMSLSFGAGVATRITGRPALSFDVSSSAADGVTHEGEIVVTWQSDQVFVLSYSVRAEAKSRLEPALRECVQSFTLEVDPDLPLPKSKPEDTLADLFDTWRSAVQEHNFALYRKLHPTGFDTAENRAAFVQLTTRLGRPEIRLTRGKVDVHDSMSEVECLVTGPGTAETMMLRFMKSKGAFRITSM